MNDTRSKFTEYARQIYPDDPTKVDYPFYMLSRWLRGKTKSQRVLKQHLKFLIDIYEKTGQPPVKYNIVVRDMSSYERRVKEALEALDVVYHYESNIFRLTEGAPSYKPDFILPDYQRNGKTILLEPHGIWTPPRRNRVRIGSRWMEVTAPGEPSVDEREFIEKLTLFRQLYGHSFYLILLIPPMHYKYVETQYPEAYDELRLIDDVPRVLHDIYKYHV